MTSVIDNAYGIKRKIKLSYSCLDGKGLSDTGRPTGKSQTGSNRGSLSTYCKRTLSPRPFLSITSSNGIAGTKPRRIFANEERSDFVFDRIFLNLHYIHVPTVLSALLRETTVIRIASPLHRLSATPPNTQERRRVAYLLLFLSRSILPSANPLRFFFSAPNSPFVYSSPFSRIKLFGSVPRHPFHQQQWPTATRTISPPARPRASRSERRRLSRSTRSSVCFYSPVTMPHDTLLVCNPLY